MAKQKAVIQSIVFYRKEGWDDEKSVKWLHSHNKKVPTPDFKKNTIRYRQLESNFKKYRLVKQGKGIAFDYGIGKDDPSGDPPRDHPIDPPEGENPLCYQKKLKMFSKSFGLIIPAEIVADQNWSVNHPLKIISVKQGIFIKSFKKSASEGA